MNVRHIGTAQGRDVFVTGIDEEAEPAAPHGYSIAAIVLPDGWKSDEIGSLLNRLYGALSDWTEFDANAGARSFIFYGERAEEASNLCDAFAYAWSNGADEPYNEVIASSSDAPDVDAFVEAMLSGNLAVSDTYAEKISNLIFAVPDSLIDAVTAAIRL